MKMQIQIQILVAALGVTVVSMLHAAPPVPAPKAAAKPVTIKPSKAHEKCMVLNASQTLEYEFRTSAKVDFNVHYHKGEAVYYPVKFERTAGETGEYEARVREEYCLMWENKTKTDVELTYSYKTRK